MREIMLTDLQFNGFVYRYLAQDTAKGDGDWEAGLRLMRKLKDPEQTKLVPKTENEKKAEQDGHPIYQFRHLVDKTATFLLEEDEWRFLRDKMESKRDQVPLMANEDFEEILDAISGAEKYDPDPPEKDKD